MTDKLNKTEIVKVFNNQFKRYLADIKTKYTDNITVISSIETFLNKYLKSDSNRIVINLFVDKILIDDDLVDSIKKKDTKYIINYGEDDEGEEGEESTTSIIKNNKFFKLLMPIFKKSTTKYQESLLESLTKLIKLADKFYSASE